MATWYHYMVCKWRWYRLPERLPQHQTRKSIDIRLYNILSYNCLSYLNLQTIQSKCMIWQDLEELQLATHPPTHSRYSTVDFFIPSNGEYPQTSIFLELPWPTWQKWKCMLKSATISSPQHDSTYFIWLSHSASFHCSKNRHFPTWCSWRKHSTHPCSFYHFPNGSSAEYKVSRYEGQALSRCASGWRRCRRNDILGIASSSRNGSNSWLVVVFLVSYRKCMYKLIYLDSVVMCTHTSACRWPL